MAFKHLLAKSTGTPLHPESAQTLLGHTRNTIAAMRSLCATLEKPVGEFLGKELPTSGISRLACAAAWLHDLGKANDHFQETVRGKRRQQGARHESVGLVVISDLLKEWLTPIGAGLPVWAFDALLCAVSGHHLKFPEDGNSRPGTRLTFLGGHADIGAFLREGVALFGLTEPPTMSDITYSLLTFGGDFPEKLVKIRRGLFVPPISETARKTVAALKALLMCADLAGSALPDRGQNVDDWLKRRIETILREEDLIEIVQDRLKGAEPRAFQRELADAREKTVILEAGCGSGKTAGAYLWASRHAAGRRLFFCYPTTTTASEGFLGYMQDPAFEAILKHSRVEVDYRLLEGLPERSEEQQAIRRLELEALETWPVPVVVCTAHNVLGILQNFRTGLYEWPSLIRSAYVFDEVHSYSPLLFEHLLRFIRTFTHVPILLMTATLPPHRREALLAAAGGRGDCRLVRGPVERERAKRYRLETSDPQKAWERVEEVIAGGKKVLWVCNTVGSAFEMARKADERLLPVELFHSRFRYRDRLRRQRDLVQAFAKPDHPLLAITTQIAEMSLDLSADVLVSEIAPVPAMVQRLGRLNRFAEIPSLSCPALFIEPTTGFPYGKSKSDLAWSEVPARWLTNLESMGDVSQDDLMRLYFQVSPQEEISDSETLICEWLNDPTRSRSAKTIMEPGFTVDLVRSEDLDAGPAAEMVIPMPFPSDKSWTAWQRKGRYLIAPPGMVEYEEKRGAVYAQRQSDPWII